MMTFVSAMSVTTILLLLAPFAAAISPWLLFKVLD